MGWTIPIPPVAYTPEIATDTTSRAVSATSYTQVSGDFAVPANDAESGSVYKMRFWGTVQQGTTTSLNFAVVLFGATLPAAGVTLGNPTAPSAAGFYIDVWVIVITPGASGSVSALIEYLGPQTTTTATPLLTEISSLSVSTVASSTFGIEAKWTGGTAGTMTGLATVYERDGPGSIPVAG